MKWRIFARDVLTSRDYYELRRSSAADLRVLRRTHVVALLPPYRELHVLSRGAPMYYRNDEAKVEDLRVGLFGAKRSCRAHHELRLLPRPRVVPLLQPINKRFPRITRRPMAAERESQPWHLHRHGGFAAERSTARNNEQRCRFPPEKGSLSHCTIQLLHQDPRSITRVRERKFPDVASLAVVSSSLTLIDDLA